MPRSPRLPSSTSPPWRVSFMHAFFHCGLSSVHVLGCILTSSFLSFLSSSPSLDRHAAVHYAPAGRCREPFHQCRAHLQLCLPPPRRGPCPHPCNGAAPI